MPPSDLFAPNIFGVAPDPPASGFTAYSSDRAVPPFGLSSLQGGVKRFGGGPSSSSSPHVDFYEVSCNGASGSSGSLNIMAGGSGVADRSSGVVQLPNSTFMLQCDHKIGAHTCSFTTTAPESSMSKQRVSDHKSSCKRFQKLVNAASNGEIIVEDQLKYQLHRIRAHTDPSNQEYVCAFEPTGLSCGTDRSANMCFRPIGLHSFMCLEGADSQPYCAHNIRPPFALRSKTVMSGCRRPYGTGPGCCNTTKQHAQCFRSVNCLCGLPLGPTGVRKPIGLSIVPIGSIALFAPTYRSSPDVQANHRIMPRICKPK